MASAEYHRRQAETLTKLAQTSREREIAAALERLAADHIALADEAGPVATVRRQEALG